MHWASTGTCEFRNRSLRGVTRRFARAGAACRAENDCRRHHPSHVPRLHDDDDNDDDDILSAPDFRVTPVPAVRCLEWSHASRLVSLLTFSFQSAPPQRASPKSSGHRNSTTRRKSGGVIPARQERKTKKHFSDCAPAISRCAVVEFGSTLECGLGCTTFGTWLKDFFECCPCVGLAFGALLHFSDDLR